ncbi:MAG: hypothetical protein CL677_01710 [Bdellovibrionaceae bacterium]|nr:hypothetical protein [Pseudobdellovibrionaceae bacterium]|tara:strand:+ start:106143 stop:106589 length:447 start_codon:yes stop_codon:yes gene_type:complete
MNKEIYERLENLAFKETIPFCYSCYKYAPTGRCKTCFSDDLMRHLEGVGVEFGTGWVIKALLEECLEQPDFEEIFEQSIDDCYGEEVRVGWLTLNPAQIIKNEDPISWEMAKSEYIDSLVEDGEIFEFSGNYYWVNEIEALLVESEAS